MQLDSSISAVVTGGASGLGAATCRQLAAKGVKIAIFDFNAELGEQLAGELGGVFCKVDVTQDAQVDAGFAKARAANGQERMIQINLIGSFRCLAKSAAGMLTLDTLADGERGVIVNTGSVAAQDGQMGQVAYSASKNGIVGMTLPIARDLMGEGIRVNTILPGLFQTPLLLSLPPNVLEALAASVPFPKRLGRPDEFAHLVETIVSNAYLNGETIRLDGAIRMAPR
jgi:NAD(P)-dependent dehydrogenase (short-subunit alcohol dehydrogenase family)